MNTKDIKIDDSALNEHGFIKFSLPLNGNNNGNSSNTMMMTLWHKDRARIMYCHFYKSDLDSSIKSLEQKLQAEEWIDDNTARSLVTYFRNECLLLRETEEFFNGSRDGTSKKSKSVEQQQGFFFQIPPKLKKHNISKIAKEGSTILIQMNGKAIRFDIEPKWSKTTANFEKQAKGLGITDQKLKQEIIFYLSEQWLKLLENGNGHTTTGEQHNGNNNGRAASAVIREDSAQIALGLVGEQCSELFLDQFGSPYAAVRIGEHSETLPLKSSRFKNWLCRIFYRSEQDVLNNENVTNVLNILKARAEFDGIAKNLTLRVANIQQQQEEPYTIFYDLTNKDWQVIKITENGWNIQYAPTSIFRRYSNQQPQVYPSKEYTPDIFDKFMQLTNVKGEDNRLLLKCYIISLFYPEIPKPILMLHGEQGSAKTTDQELKKMLVDPSSIRTLTFPRDINELVQKLSHNYIAYFDNMSNIPEWISDQLCRAVTGSGFSKRELYTDDDDIIYNFKRCIGLNGINLAATKADLLDRGIIIELERITKDKIRKVEEIWQEFEKIKPQLLGYIFDILVKVLQVKRSGGIEIKEGLPRMADFAELGEIISRCMGHEDNKFLGAYYNNIGLQVEAAIESSPVGTTIIKLMEDKQEWEGTATNLLNDLEPIANELKINTSYKLWPKSANSLSRRVTEVKTNLREIGITIKYDKDTKTRVKIIKICKLSFISFESFEDINHAQITSDNPNDIDGNLNDISFEDNKISFDKIPQNHAQISSPNDMNDPNDIIRPKSIYSLGHSDTWACHDCKQRGDKWFMEKHLCKGVPKK